MKIEKDIEIISNEEETLVIEDIKVTNDGGDNMSKPKKKVKGIYKIIIILLVLGIIGCLGYYFYGEHLKELERFFNMKESFYVGSDNTSAILYDFEYNETSSVIRGNKIDKYINYEKDPNNMEYSKVKYNNVDYLIKDNNLVKDYDSVVFEKELFVKSNIDIKKDNTSSILNGHLKKGDSVNIIGFEDLSDGVVGTYKVSINDSIGYIDNKYLINDHTSSLVYYNDNGFYDKHKNTKTYSNGNGSNLYYDPVIKGDFTDNVMPDKVYALYLNSSNDIIKNIDSYINFAKETKINAFVVDIIDDSSVAYPANTMKEMSPSSYSHAMNSYDNFKSAVKKLNDAGFYTIARITAFKDSYYVNDNKDTAISKNGSPYKHQSAYWPSAYNRKIWEYNVKLGIEVVEDLGFNEVQYDYCRFPDGLGKISGIDYKNTYNETMAQAIQGFLMYATDEIHKHHAYVSVDVFGESAWGYVTSYGQYWPAMSNIVDAISGMPYLDHFGDRKSVV